MGSEESYTDEFTVEDTTFVRDEQDVDDIIESLDESLQDDEISSMEEGFVRGYRRARDTSHEA